VWLNPSEYIRAGTQVPCYFISFGFRKRSLVVSVAGCLLIFGAARDEPLHVFPEFFTPMTGPLAADLNSSVSWRPGFPSKSMAGPSKLTIAAFAPATERLPEARVRANVSSPPVTVQPVSSASLVGVRGVADTSIGAQRRRQAPVDAGNKAINLAQLAATAAGAIAEAAKLREVRQLQLSDAVFGDHPDASKKVRGSIE
jgi:hypothetical protein